MPGTPHLLRWDRVRAKSSESGPHAMTGSRHKDMEEWCWVSLSIVVFFPSALGSFTNLLSSSRSLIAKRTEDCNECAFLLPAHLDRFSGF